MGEHIGLYRNVIDAFTSFRLLDFTSSSTASIECRRSSKVVRSVTVVSIRGHTGKLVTTLSSSAAEGAQQRVPKRRGAE